MMSLTRAPACLAPQADNARMEELLSRRRAEGTVLAERRRRLEAQLAHQEREAKGLRAAGERLQVRLAGGAAAARDTRGADKVDVRPCVYCRCLSSSWQGVSHQHTALALPLPLAFPSCRRSSSSAWTG